MIKPDDLDRALEDMMQRGIHALEVETFFPALTRGSEELFERASVGERCLFVAPYTVWAQWRERVPVSVLNSIAWVPDVNIDQAEAWNATCAFVWGGYPEWVVPKVRDVVDRARCRESDFYEKFRIPDSRHPQFKPADRIDACEPHRFADINERSGPVAFPLDTGVM